MLNSRQLFYDFKEQYNVRGLTDIQRAARYFMLIKTSYGSKINSYGCVKKNINVMINYLDAIQERLSRVVIENKDFEGLIKVYNKPNTLFYLDPPYYGTEKYYQAKFKEEDHVRLKEAVIEIKGKFIMTYNDCDYIRDLYQDYNIESVTRNHNLRSRFDDKDKKYQELIITNY